MTDFESWKHESLVKFAKECYLELKYQKMAEAQAKADFKEAMRQLRKLTTKGSK